MVLLGPAADVALARVAHVRVGAAGREDRAGGESAGGGMLAALRHDAEEFQRLEGLFGPLFGERVFRSAVGEALAGAYILVQRPSLSLSRCWVWLLSPGFRIVTAIT